MGHLDMDYLDYLETLDLQVLEVNLDHLDPEVSMDLLAYLVNKGAVDLQESRHHSKIFLGHQETLVILVTMVHLVLMVILDIKDLRDREEGMEHLEDLDKEVLLVTQVLMDQCFPKGLQVVLELRETQVTVDLQGSKE